MPFAVCNLIRKKSFTLAQIQQIDGQSRAMSVLSFQCIELGL
jgi:hypothetical protein